MQVYEFVTSQSANQPTSQSATSQSASQPRASQPVSQSANQPISQTPNKRTAKQPNSQTAKQSVSPSAKQLTNQKAHQPIPQLTSGSNDQATQLKGQSNERNTATKAAEKRRQATYFLACLPPCLDTRWLTIILDFFLFPPSSERARLVGWFVRSLGGSPDGHRSKKEKCTKHNNRTQLATSGEHQYAVSLWQMPPALDTHYRRWAIVLENVLTCTRGSSATRSTEYRSVSRPALVTRHRNVVTTTAPHHHTTTPPPSVVSRQLSVVKLRLAGAR